MIKIMKYGQVPNSEIFSRVTPAVDVASIVADILYDVRKNGDKAVLAYCAKFDKAELDTLEVSRQEIEEALNSVEPGFLEILKEAAENNPLSSVKPPKPKHAEEKSKQDEVEA